MPSGRGLDRVAQTVRQAKTATVRAVVPKAYRDVAAGAGLYGRALDAADRGHTEVSERMKSKAGQWMQGNRGEPGQSGNFSGNHSSRLPGQRAADTTASVARNAKGVDVAGKLASKAGLAEKLGLGRVAGTVLADLAKVGPQAMKVAGKLALPLSIAAAGADAAYQGITRGQKEGFVGGVEGAAWGALDSISFGIANWAMGRNADGTPIGKGGAATPQSFRPQTGEAHIDGQGTSGQKISPASMKSFNHANMSFEGNRNGNQSKEPSSDQRKGFQRPKNQASAQAALQHNYSGPSED